MRRLALLLFLGLTVLFSLGNWALPLIDRDEPRFAEASREMRQSGDFIIPRLNGENRFDKPPLIYWCQTLAYQGFGENDFAARFPSVFFAAATAVLTALWGARLAGRTVGVWAGIIFGTTLQVFVHARAAVADMPMVFFFLAATWSAWERVAHRDRPALWLAFYGSLAFGFLAKGPVALLPVCVTPAYAALTRTRVPLRWSSTLTGTLLLVCLVGLWGAPALLRTQGEFFSVGIGKHVVARSLEPMESHGASGLGGYLLSLPFYALTLFFSFLPWSVFLPGTFRRIRRSREPFEVFLLVAAGLILLVFSLIRTKLPHYILPAFPLLSLLVARTVVRSSGKQGLAAGTIGLYSVIALVGFPALASYFPSRRIAEELRPYLTAATRTASVGYDEQSLVWYLRDVTRSFHRRLPPAAFDSFMRQPGPAICVVNREMFAQLVIDPSWRVVSARGLNFARWQLHRLDRTSIRFPKPQGTELLGIVKQ